MSLNTTTVIAFLHRKFKAISHGVALRTQAGGSGLIAVGSALCDVPLVAILQITKYRSNCLRIILNLRATVID